MLGIDRHVLCGGEIRLPPHLLDCFDVVKGERTRDIITLARFHHWIQTYFTFLCPVSLPCK